MASSDITLKVELDGDLRRFRFTPGKNDDETWDALCSAIRGGFELPEGSDVRLKYKDEEGDLCTLARATVSDCLEQQRALAAAAGFGPIPPLRLWGEIRRSEGPKTASVAAPPAPPAMPIKSAAPIDSPAPTSHAKAAESTASWGSGSCSGSGGASTPPGFGSWGGKGGCGSRGGGSGGCSGMGPWKLLACLASLRASGRMTANMVASLSLQFLPILAQRAHRKQEKLNLIGGEHREALLPTLHRILIHLERIEEAQATVRPSLERFVSGADSSRLGDALAGLLKLLAGHKDRAAVAELIKGASEELLDLLLHIFPGFFTEVPPGPPCPLAAAAATHIGCRCVACGADPLIGPRFANAESGVDVCGECFIDYAAAAAADGASAASSSSSFECHLAPWGGATASGAGDRGGGAEDPVAKAWRDGIRKFKDDMKVWWETAALPHFKGKGKFKGKDKGKGKCKGKAMTMAAMKGWAPPGASWGKGAGEDWEKWTGKGWHSRCKGDPSFAAGADTATAAAGADAHDPSAAAQWPLPAHGWPRMAWPGAAAAPPWAPVAHWPDEQQQQQQQQQDENPDWKAEQPEAGDAGAAKATNAPASDKAAS